MAALRITRCAENPREALEVMFDGGFNVAEACVRHEVKKLVAASSASIWALPTRFRQTRAITPTTTLYGAAKMANESCTGR